MATFNKYQNAVEALTEGANIGTDTWRVILSNTAPNAATNTNQASATELTTGGGYTANGNACAVTSSAQTGGVQKLVLASPAQWVGTGAGFTYRYVILWNQTVDALFGYWDKGLSQTVAAGDTLNVNFDGVNGVFTVA